MIFMKSFFKDLALDNKFQVTVIIDKSPPSRKKNMNTLKHKKLKSFYLRFDYSNVNTEEPEHDKKR